MSETFAPLRSFRFTVHIMPEKKIGYSFLPEKTRAAVRGMNGGAIRIGGI